jgi:hypothetical protein
MMNKSKYLREVSNDCWISDTEWFKQVLIVRTKSGQRDSVEEFKHSFFF